MRTQTFILLGMIIIVISALASLQSVVSVENNAALAVLRILALLIGLVMVIYGTLQLRAQRANPPSSGGRG